MTIECILIKSSSAIFRIMCHIVFMKGAVAGDRIKASCGVNVFGVVLVPSSLLAISPMLSSSFAILPRDCISRTVPKSSPRIK